MTMELSDEQLAAVAHGCDIEKRITAVSGPAGTGKTTIMKTIKEQFVAWNYSVVLCAPTGKAARRIQEATGIPAVTIHKLLEYGRPGEYDEKTGKAVDPTYPSRNNRNRLDQTIILVDEYAMVSQELHVNLIAAMKSGAKIVAFGDEFQLPPIEPYKAKDRKGQPMLSPFKTLIANDSYVCRLTKVYRQKADSNILANANKICQGHTPSINKDEADWMLKLTDQPIKELIKYIDYAKKEKDIDFTKIDAQIVTASKKSWVGTHKLNHMLRMHLNPHPTEETTLPREKWDEEFPVTVGIGDKVLCNSNTYDLRDFFERYGSFIEGTNQPKVETYIPCPDTKMVLNGETGIVVAINEDLSIEVDFGDRIVEIPHMINEYWQKRDTIIDSFPQKILTLGYALTTHKTQGSEFKHVCYMMNKSTRFVQSRQNFYTAVTRASETCVVLTDQQSLQYALRTVRV